MSTRSLPPKQAPEFEKPQEGRGRHVLFELATRALDEAEAHGAATTGVSVAATATVDGGVILRTVPPSVNSSRIAPVVAEATARGPSKSQVRQKEG